MTGSLQIKNGKYQIVLNLTDLNGKRKQKWISTGLDIKGNKRNAEKILREKLEEYEDHQVINSDIMFHNYLLHWLDCVKNNIDIITYQSYSSVVNSHIIPYFEMNPCRLSKLNREVIQEYIDFKATNGRLDGKGGLAPKTIREQKLIIQLASKEAIKEKLISVNPCELVKVPKAVKREATFYNQDELEQLFQKSRNEKLYPLIYITVIYGLRRSEVLGLKWDSVNFQNKTVTIKHTVVRHNSVVRKDTTKTASSYRIYPMDDEVENLLLKIKCSEEINRKTFGDCYIENDYIFKWENGVPYNPDYITSKFSKILKNNDLPHIRFHDLRHSCASLLIAKGFSLKDIQDWLGHADFSTTANFYAHLDIGRKKSIAQSMSNSFSDLC